jgi:hypothetical protein
VQGLPGCANAGALNAKTIKKKAIFFILRTEIILPITIFFLRKTNLIGSGGQSLKKMIFLSLRL